MLSDDPSQFNKVKNIAISFTYLTLRYINETVAPCFACIGAWALLLQLRLLFLLWYFSFSPFSPVVIRLCFSNSSHNLLLGFYYYFRLPHTPTRLLLLTFSFMPVCISVFPIEAFAFSMFLSCRICCCFNIAILTCYVYHLKFNMPQFCD